MSDNSTMPSEPQFRRAGMGRLIFGLIVLGLGVTFLLDQMDIVETEQVFHYWPVILLLIAAVKLIAPTGPSDRTIGVVLGLLGLLFLGDTANFYSLDFKLVWPALLILLGLFIIKRGLFGPGRAGVFEDGGESVSIFAFWSGHERRITSRAFHGGDVTAVMGGAELDLRGARLATSGGPVIMDLFTMWGGITLVVPAEWDVIAEATAIMGAVEDKRRGVQPPAGEAEGSAPRPRLLLRGLVLMAGVEIKN